MKAARISIYSTAGGIMAGDAVAHDSDCDGRPLWNVRLDGVSAGELLAFAREVAYASTGDGRDISAMDFAGLERDANARFQGTNLFFGKDFDDIPEDVLDDEGEGEGEE